MYLPYHWYPQLLHLKVLLIFPSAKTPNNTALPTLLFVDIFSIFVDWQVGHFGTFCSLAILHSLWI
jgi:hypothetical protein